MKVPEDAFEMNYIFTDGEGATDNNMGQNYLTMLDSVMTPELWAERAMDRLVSLRPFFASHCCLTNLVTSTLSPLIIQGRPVLMAGLTETCTIVVGPSFHCLVLTGKDDISRNPPIMYV